jgi:5-methylcytosine-specific restriction endonuclease McrA
MPPNVLLQPCGLPAQAHFNQTIRTPVATRRILENVDERDHAKLAPLLAPLSAVPIWGIEPSDNTSLQKAWRDLKPGDLAVFGGLNRVLASGFIIAKFESEQLGRSLWDGVAGETWKNIYLLDSVELYDNLSILELNQVAGYKPEARPQNLRLLTDDIARRLVDWLGSLEERKLKAGVDPILLETLNAISDDDTDDLDPEGARKYRLQQIRERSATNRLRVLERKGHICEVCGYDFAKQFGDGFSPSISVHHKNPLALGERQARSLNEFAVLCSSCHTAAHMGPGRKLHPWAIEELRELVTRRWDQ